MNPLLPIQKEPEPRPSAVSDLSMTLPNRIAYIAVQISVIQDLR